MNGAVNRAGRRLLVLLAWALLLTLAWGLWLWRLDTSDLTFDEAGTYFVAYRPPLEILSYLRGAVREHPPVYYLLIRGWMALAGTSEFSLRLFSVGTGVLGLVLTGRLARLVLGRFGDVGAFLAVAFLAVMPGMAYYARVARMYSLGVVWTALSAGLFLRDWLSSGAWPRRTALASLVAVHMLALFTHYYLLFPILVQPVVLLLLRRWKPFLAWCGAHGLPALAGLLWLQMAPGLQMTAGGLFYGLSLPAPSRFELLYLLGKLLFSPVVRVRFGLLDTLLLLVCVGLLLALWRRRRVGVWLTLSLLIPLVLVYVMPHSPVPRFLVFLTPLVALAWGFLCVAPLHLIEPIELKWGRLRQGGATGRPASSSRSPLRFGWLACGVSFGLTVVVVRLLIAGGLYQSLAFERSRYGHTLRTVQAHARPGDGMLFYGPWQWIQFGYYHPGGLPPITTLPSRAPPRLKPDQAEPVLRDLLASYDRLWVLPAAVYDVDPARFVAGWLRTHAHNVWETGDFGLYVPPLPFSAPAQRVGLTFGQELDLEAVAYEPQPVPAGEPLRLTLAWIPRRRLERDVRLMLTLVDESGHVWDVAYPLPGEWTSPPSTWEPGQVFADYEGLTVPQGAPPGEYVVRLLVADDATGEPLLVEGRKEADLFTVQVAEPVSAPVLYGLPNPGAAIFCPPRGTPCLTLAGYEPGGLRFQQGHSVPFKLHWLVSPGTFPDVELRWRALHRTWLPPQLTPVVTRTFPLVPYYSTGSSLPDEKSGAAADAVLSPLLYAPVLSVSTGSAEQPLARLVTLKAALTLPSDAPTGPARVALEVLGPDGVPWLTTDGDRAFSLFDIAIDSRPVQRRLPAGMTRIQVDFGDEVTESAVGLRGYRVDGDARPGGEVQATYAWYARRQPTAIYAVFNHLVTADGALVVQTDGWPQEGRMLTVQWQAGEYIEDTYTLVIPPDAAPGPYTLYVGLYDAATGDRQKAFQDAQRLPEDRVRVPLPGEDGR